MPRKNRRKEEVGEPSSPTIKAPIRRTSTLRTKEDSFKKESNMVKYLEDSAKKEGNEVMEIKESESDNKKLIRPVKTEVE